MSDVDVFSATWYATCDATRIATFNAIWHVADSSTRDAIWYATRDATDIATRDATRIATLNAIWHVADNAIWVITNNNTSDVINSIIKDLK